MVSVKSRGFGLAGFGPGPTSSSHTNSISSSGQNSSKEFMKRRDGGSSSNPRRMTYTMNQDNRGFIGNHGLPPPNQEYDSFFLILNSDDEKTGADGIAAPTSHSRRRVDHTYRDYSKFPLEELPTRKRAPTNFPSKLHQILSNPEYAHVRHHLDYYFIRRRLQCDINLLIHLVSCREPSYHCINRSSRGW